MRCGDIMQAPVEACWLGEAVEDVAERMRMRHLRFMPVCNDAGEVVGTIARRDLVESMLQEHLPYGTPVFRVMSIGTITCTANDEVASIEPHVQRSREPRVICVDGRRRPIGVVDASLLISHDTHQEAHHEHA